MDSQSLFAWGQSSTSLVGLLVMLSLCSLRIAIVFMMLPATSDQALSGMSRTAVSLLFGSLVAYGEPIQLQAMQATTLVMIAVKESVIGMILGFAASTVFWVAENVGFLIDALSGFNNVQITNPMRSDISTPISSLLGQLIVTCFWVLGGMTFLLGAIYESFTWWPLMDLAPVPSSILETFVLKQTDSMMQMTVKLAMPMVLILVLVDLTFGLLAKGAEKLEPMELSQPVKGVVTLLMLAVFIGVFIDQVRDQIALSHIAAQFHAVMQMNPAKP